jgi:hypothetical protein
MMVDGVGNPKNVVGGSKTANFEAMILLEKVITTLGKSSQAFFKDLVLMKLPPRLHVRSPMVLLVRRGSPTTSLTDVFLLLAFCVCVW